MVPESPSVCFRCRMCKVCFLTMNEIERHLKATNHYIRPSSNSSSNSTKENSTANESSDDKPLNLSSKSALPPLSTPAKPAEIDLTLSSDDSEHEEDKNAKGTSVLKDTKDSKGEIKSVQAAETTVVRKASEEDSLSTKNSTFVSDASQDDLADVETDTVSSTSSDPPPPPDKTVLTSTTSPPTTIEAEVSTQFPEIEEEKSRQTCSTTQNCGNSDKESREKLETEAPAMNAAIKRRRTLSTNKCDAEQEIGSSMIIDGQEEKTMETPTSTSATVEEKAIEEDCINNKGNIDESEMNENDEPKTQNGPGQEIKMKTITESIPRKKKQKKKYRCRHCGEMFTFPVQVHVHMQKVHQISGESTKPTRRSSINPSNNNNNNNNNDTTANKHNVQMYPLRSLYARAKRRTRSMQSDNGTRRNSFAQNIEEKKKSTRKIIYFTCRHCGKKFPLLNQLKIHLHKVHPEKVKKTESTLNGGFRRKRKHFTSKRLVISSKRRQTAPLLVQSQNRSQRISTRSVSRSAESEPETVRMSTRRRSSAARSEKSCVESGTSSRRSSTKRDNETKSFVVKAEPKPADSHSDEEKATQHVAKTRKMRCSSGKKRSFEESEMMGQEEIAEKKPDLKTLSMESAMHAENNEEESIYNDSDCMIIDTVETILYALTSKRSQTCPNCNKYCKFAGNFKLHLKACMNLDDDLELIHDDGGGQRKPKVAKEESHEDEEGEETDAEMEEDDEEKSESSSETEEDKESSSIPYYQKLEYRRCWECGFVVSKFHNLSRHLKQRHNVTMGTKEMHAKQAEVLRLK